MNMKVCTVILCKKKEERIFMNMKECMVMLSTVTESDAILILAVEGSSSILDGLWEKPDRWHVKVPGCQTWWLV